MITRGIKFRIFDEQFEKFRYWGFIGGMFVSPKLDDFSLEYLESQSQKFIGLHDKNGREIYEGDIVNSSDTCDHADIRWHKDDSAYIAGYGGTEWDYLYELMDLEVIGNIHENPELLEDG